MKIKTAFFIIFFYLLLCVPARAYELKKYELALGGGSNMNSIVTAQVMLIGARNFDIKQNLFFRIEPTLEFMTKSGENMLVGGVSAVFRFASPRKEITPFVDFGAGLNFSDKQNFLGRDIGTNFLFDLLLGAGFNIGHKMSVSYRYRHLSNAGIGTSNDGWDSWYILFGMYFN